MKKDFLRGDSRELTRLARGLLAVAGRDGAGCTVQLTPEGGVQVCNRHTVAFYPGDAWTSKFVRNIYAGFFDAPAVGRHARQAAGSRGVARIS